MHDRVTRQCTTKDWSTCCSAVEAERLSNSTTGSRRAVLSSRGHKQSTTHLPPLGPLGLLCRLPVGLAVPQVGLPLAGVLVPAADTADHSLRMWLAHVLAQQPRSLLCALARLPSLRHPGVQMRSTVTSVTESCSSLSMLQELQHA
jgi:hypothetical protein